MYLSFYPAAPPHEDYVQLHAPEKEKCDYEELKCFQ